MYMAPKDTGSVGFHFALSISQFICLKGTQIYRASACLHTFEYAILSHYVLWFVVHKELPPDTKQYEVIYPFVH
jgi:hypothetical protein